MTSLTRKQREIRERERLILDTARKMVIEGGYLGLSMDRVAEAIEYSKGTIYQHFGCKEDLMAGLLSESFLKRVELFEKAASMQGLARERIMAIGVADLVFAEGWADHFKIEQLVRAASIAEKVSEKQKTAILACEKRCDAAVDGIIDDAVAAGDLELRDGVSGFMVKYGLWSMSVGHHSLSGGGMREMIQQLDNTDLTSILWLNYNMLLDGFGWRPLSVEKDYGEVVLRIRNEVFGDES